MKAIAIDAGVAERTLFNIYASKAALVAISARERTRSILREAWDTAEDQDIGFFLSLTRTLSCRTLEDPEVARALAPVLTHHAQLVDLDHVYDQFVGRALEGLIEKGAIDAQVAPILSRLIAMRMVSAVTLWAGGVIADDLLEPHMRLALCEVLVPHVRAPVRDWAAGEAARCLRELLATKP